MRAAYTRPPRRLLQIALLAQAPLDRRPPIGKRRSHDQRQLDLAAQPVEPKKNNTAQK